MASGGNHQLTVADSNASKSSYPRPRLQWTRQLHDQFVKAVDELGGADKATPKAILDSMGVERLTLENVKSHLQKYRLGKITTWLRSKEYVRENYGREKDENSAPMNLEAQEGSSSDNNGNMASADDTCENLHFLLVEPTENSEMAEKTSGITMVNQEGGSSSMTTSVEMDVAAGESTMDEYLASLGFSPTEIAAFNTSHEPSRASRVFGSFFDEVETFTKAEHDDPMMDDNAVAMETGDLSAHFTYNNYP